MEESVCTSLPGRSLLFLMDSFPSSVTIPSSSEFFFLLESVFSLVVCCGLFYQNVVFLLPNQRVIFPTSVMSQ